MADITAGRGARPRPFMKAPRPRPARSAPAARAQGRDRAPQRRRVASAAVRRAPARAARALRAAGLRLGARDQVRRLPDADARGRRHGHAPHAQGTRLDAPLPGNRARGEALPDCLLDGEIVALDKRGVPSFSALQAGLVDEETGDFIYFVFDLLHADGKDLRKSPLSTRKQRLSELLASGPARLRYVEHFETGAEAVLKSACRMSLEGVVSKRLDSPYRSGRGDAWLKTKCRAGHEVVIGGWTIREGQLRSLLAGVYRRGRLAYVGRIGTGFGQKAARGLAAKLRALEIVGQPLQRKGRAAEGRGRALGEAGTGRRNRVRRLDRLRHAAAGCVQGTSGRQGASRRGIRTGQRGRRLPTGNACSASASRTPTSRCGRTRVTRGA